MCALWKTLLKEVEYINAKRQKKKMVDGLISCIAQNKENFISFSWGQLWFVNSFSFLSASLDKLVSNTAKEDLLITKEMPPFDFLTRKKRYTHANTWMILVYMMKQHCWLKIDFTVDYLMSISVMRNKIMRKTFGVRLDVKHWAVIMICTWRVMWTCCQMYFRISEG